MQESYSNVKHLATDPECNLLLNNIVIIGNTILAKLSLCVLLCL